MKKLLITVAAASFVITGTAFAGWADHSVSSKPPASTTDATMQTVTSSATAAHQNAKAAVNASAMAAETGHPQHVNTAIAKTNQAISSTESLKHSLNAQKAHLVHQASQSGTSPSHTN